MCDVSFLIHTIKSLVATAASEAKSCNENLFKDNSDKTSELSSLAYLQKGYTSIMTAKSIYVCNIEHLQNFDLEEIFSSYEIMFDEVICNVATDHSHQWSDIEYNRFTEIIGNFL